MRTMSYSESRRRYAEVLDSVVQDREEIVITREVVEGRGQPLYIYADRRGDVGTSA